MHMHMNVTGCVCALHSRLHWCMMCVCDDLAYDDRNYADEKDPARIEEQILAYVWCNAYAYVYEMMKTVMQRWMCEFVCSLQQQRQQHSFSILYSSIRWFDKKHRDRPTDGTANHIVMTPQRAAWTWQLPLLRDEAARGSGEEKSRSNGRRLFRSPKQR